MEMLNAKIDQELLHIYEQSERKVTNATEKLAASQFRLNQLLRNEATANQLKKMIGEMNRLGVTTDEVVRGRELMIPVGKLIETLTGALSAWSSDKTRMETEASETCEQLGCQGEVSVVRPEPEPPFS
jgi:hypothetical protein